MSYKTMVPYKNFKGQPRNQQVEFNLTEREVFRMLTQLKFVYDWMSSQQSTEIREIPTEEVVEFYTVFEEILLEAYGEMSEDGEFFKKGNRFQFEESALFNACMLMFVTNPDETGKLLSDIMPEGLLELVKNAETQQAGMEEHATLQSEIDRLKRQLAEKDKGSDATPTA